MPVDFRFAAPDFLADAGVPLASDAGAASGSAGAAALSSDFFASADSAGALDSSASAGAGSFFSSVAVSVAVKHGAGDISERH